MKLIAAVVTILAISIVTTNAQGIQHIPGKLSCSSHSGNPQKLRAFQRDVTFDLSGVAITMERKTANGGEEKFIGTVNSTGDILISGTGKGKISDTWTYEFRGKRNDKNDTVLKGKLTQTNGLAGTRDCTLRFYKPRSL
jgi:hypothetical protein